jgi:hypothetical protein
MKGFTQMIKMSDVNRRFSEVTEELKSTMDEAYFEMLGIDGCLDTHWGPDPDERMLYSEAIEAIDAWTQVIDMLDMAASDLQALQMYYYQKVVWPEMKPTPPEKIGTQRLVVNFAIHRVNWVVKAYETQDPDMMKLLTPDRAGELTYKTIAREIKANPQTVAHWHTGYRKIPQYSSVLHKLAEFYKLSDIGDAYYYLTDRDQLIPWRYVGNWRGGTLQEYLDHLDQVKEGKAQKSNKE